MIVLEFFFPYVVNLTYTLIICVKTVILLDVIYHLMLFNTPRTPGGLSILSDNMKFRNSIIIYFKKMNKTRCKEARFLCFTGVMNFFFFQNLCLIFFPGHIGSEIPRKEKMNAKSIFFQKICLEMALIGKN